MYKLYILYYDRTNASGGTDVNKTNASKEYDICHYWCFLDKEFKFAPSAYNECHNLLIISINLHNITILNIHSIDYCCNINGNSKSDPVYKLQHFSNDAFQSYYDLCQVQP